MPIEHQESDPSSSTCSEVSAVAHANDFDNRSEPVDEIVRKTPARRREAPREAKAHSARYRRLFGIAHRPLPPYAKFDDSSVIVKGLFTSLDPNAPAPSGRIEFKKLLRDEECELTISCGTRLGDSDQRVLRALVACATDAYSALAADRRYGRAPVHDPALKIKVKCTLDWLAQVAGFRSPGAGPTNNVIRQSLQRLCDVKLIWRKAGDQEVVKDEMLIVNEGCLQGHGSINVSFHSTLQKAILASRPDEHYLCINMNAARQLKSRNARLLHHRLTHVNAGASLPHSLQTLQSYLWGTDAPNPKARNYRENQLFAAMAELELLGWRFEASGQPGCVKVTRPAADSLKAAEALQLDLPPKSRTS